MGCRVFLLLDAHFAVVSFVLAVELREMELLLVALQKATTTWSRWREGLFYFFPVDVLSTKYPQQYRGSLYGGLA